MTGGCCVLKFLPRSADEKHLTRFTVDRFSEPHLKSFPTDFSNKFSFPNKNGGVYEITTGTATGTSPNKRSNEQNKGCARAL